MKKSLILISIILNAIFLLAQSNDFDNGFKNGYKEGYCYRDFGCMAPMPPMTPMPALGETYANYQEGYNLGFKTGLEHKRTKSNSTPNRLNQNNQINTTPANNNILKPVQVEIKSNYRPPNYDMINRAMQLKQERENRELQIKKERAISQMNQTKSFYSSVSNYPDIIADGWYKVISMNNYDFCEERKVYVQNNTVTKYVIDNWLEREVNYSSKILKGKTMINLKDEKGEIQDLLELYFLDYLTNNESQTTPPLGSGKLTFWTNWKRHYSLQLYLDEFYVGSFETYQSSPPTCNTQGTLTIDYKPGTYNYRVISNSSNKEWSGTVVIKKDDCTIQSILK